MRPPGEPGAPLDRSLMTEFCRWLVERVNAVMRPIGKAIGVLLQLALVAFLLWGRSVGAGRPRLNPLG